MECEGMVAVVRGLKDAGLAVTLLDGGRSYTLQPHCPHVKHPVSYNTSAQCTHEAVKNESAAQATDGRYTSTYKMMHCHLKPTSPQTEVTEFPPQRAELCPGQGNFEIGGHGSGETYQAKKASSFRGGLNWPDKGSVFTSRPSVQPDSFASSLRKYPAFSPERSSEIMERFINYAHTRSGVNSKSSSPTRVLDSDYIQSMDRTRSRNDQDFMKYRRCEESPTRDRVKREEESWRSPFGRNQDVRYLKEVTRLVKEGIRGSYSNQPERLPREIPSPERHSIQKSSNSVNMEIQAAVQMVSREVVTTPRDKPSQRHVAIPLTPTASRPENALGTSPDPLNQESFTKSIQATIDLNGKAISSEDISIHRRSLRKRSISDEEIRVRKNKRDMLRSLRSERDTHKNLKYKDRCSKRHKCNSFPKNSYDRRPQVFYTEIASKTIDEEDLAEVLDDWLSIIPLKATDYFGRPIEKDFLFYDLFERLKYTAYHLPEHNRREKIKAEIIELLNDFPVDYKGNKNIFFSRLADVLIDKIKNLSKSAWPRRKTRNGNLKSFYDFAINRYIPPTEDELRRFLNTEIETFIKKAGLTLGRYTILGLEEELLDIVVVFMENVHSHDDNIVKQDIIDILLDHGFLEQQASRFSHILLKHLKDVFIDEFETGIIKSETVIVLPSIPQDTNANTILGQSGTQNIDANITLEDYTKKLCDQINEWLTSLQTILPRINEKGFRQVVVNDLAGDIIDRYKYLEMNPTSKGSEEAELEHLKYQIFKWISKLADEDTLQPSKHAPELMRRIQSIPVPIFSKNNSKKSKSGQDSICPSGSCKAQSVQRDSVSNQTQSNQAGPSKTNAKPVDYVKTVSLFTESNKSLLEKSDELATSMNKLLSPSIEKINKEYEEFVNAWVQKIPIPANTPEELALADKARLGINNGIWKAITKLKCDPSIFNNRFFLEDLLDDEVEELLNCLPQIPELKTKKNLLKLELINKTTEVIERVRAESAKNYRQQLNQSMATYLQAEGFITNIDNRDRAEEEYQMLRIVELFLLNINYQDVDVARSEVYRRKLLEQTKELADCIKKSVDSGQAINYAVVVKDIMNVLRQVPIPSDKTVKEEVDNIILEYEVENWFKDLPVFRDDNNPIEKLQWKKKTDLLAQQIRDLQSRIKDNDNLEKAIKNLISIFIDKTPIQVDALVHKNFMIEELYNRIKNLDQSKHMEINEPKNYMEFCRQAPVSSSFDKFLKPGENMTLDNTAVDYEAFSKKKPFSSSFKNGNEQIASDNNKNESFDYRDFTAGRPKRSSLKDPVNENLASQEDESQPDCCKTDPKGEQPMCCKKQPRSEFNRLGVPQEGSSNSQNVEPSRFRKPLSISKGVVFKDKDSISHSIVNENDRKISHTYNIGTTSEECQTVRRSAIPDQEIGDIEINPDGKTRTIATNTPKYHSLCNLDAARKFGLNDIEEDFRCRCIERYWRCKNRLRQFASEGFDDIPCLPFMYTCPCFY